VFLLTGVFFLNFVARVVLSPLLPPIRETFDLTFSQAGSLFLWISSGYCVGLLCSGFVSARLTHRRTILVSLAGIGLALLWMGSSGGLLGLRGGAELLGLHAGLYLPSGVASICDLVPPRQLGRALAVHDLAPNLCLVLTPFLAESMLGALSWRGVLRVVGSMCLLWSLVFGIWGRGGRGKGISPSVAAMRPIFRNPRFFQLTLLFTLAAGSTVGIFSILPLYLVNDLGMQRSVANSLIGYSRVSGVVAVLFSGWMAERFGLQWVMAVIFLVTGFSTIALGVLPAPWVFLVVFVQPVLAVCFFPLGVAELSRISPLAIALAFPFSSMLGGGGFPALIGFVAKAQGFPFALELVGAGILISSGLVLLAWMRGIGVSPGLSRRGPQT
jgi:predicted MFS family arabinose efflux permease